MSILYFLHRLAAMETGEELDGHMSGADAVDTLSYAIIEARALIAASRDPILEADGLALVVTMKALIDEALTTHIYEQDQVPSDCRYLAASNAAGIYLRNLGAGRP